MSPSRDPSSTPPILSSESRAMIGLRMIDPAICCASFTISPANAAVGTSNRNSTRTTTRLAATVGVEWRANQRCTGASATYSTGIPISPVAYGESATSSARPRATSRANAPRCLVSANVGIGAILESAGRGGSGRVGPFVGRLRVQQIGPSGRAHLTDHLAAHVHQAAARQLVEVQPAQVHLVHALLAQPGTFHLFDDRCHADRTVEVVVGVELLGDEQRAPG